MPSAATTAEPSGAPDPAERVRAVLEAADADGAVHVRRIGGTQRFALAADRPVPSASVFKILVLLEFACQVAAGTLSPTTRIRVPAGEHTMGPTGLSVLRDDVEMSARDLAVLMMQISDNTATDVVQRLVGTASVARRVAALGLTATVVEHDCRDLLALLVDELGGDPDVLDTLHALDVDERARVLAVSPSLRAECGNRTTAREMTALLELIWRDEAGPARACAETRRVMGLQHAPHRLSTAYGDGPVISGKTGTLVGVRNEVGVIDFGEGEQYAVAVFLRGRAHAHRDPAVDRAIGQVARIVVDALRTPV
jgi:beta-lactamase class A